MPDPTQGITVDGSNYNEDEIEFIRRMEEYQRKNKRRFPTFTEVLMVAHSLGWRRVAAPTELPKRPPRD